MHKNIVNSKKRSIVWHFFKELHPGNARCDLCCKILSFKGGSVFNLRRHLFKKHPTATYQNEIVEKTVAVQQKTYTAIAGAENTVIMGSSEKVIKNSPCGDAAQKRQCSGIDFFMSTSNEFSEKAINKTEQITDDDPLCMLVEDTHNSIQRLEVDNEENCTMDTEIIENVTVTDKTKFQSISKRTKDDYFIIGQSIATQLRAIPDSYSRSMAKLKIQQILFEAENGHYKKMQKKN